VGRVASAEKIRNSHKMFLEIYQRMSKVGVDRKKEDNLKTCESVEWIELSHVNVK